MAIYRLGDKVPIIADDVYIADTASVIGAVTIGPGSSVWSSAVIRADNDTVTIGARTNIQDSAVLHADPGEPLTIGDDVTVGHQAMLHGCTISDGALIGIQAVVLNGALVGKECLVGAGALITERKNFDDRDLIVGAPARAIKNVSDEVLAIMKRDNADYVRRAAQVRVDLERIG